VIIVPSGCKLRPDLRIFLTLPITLFSSTYRCSNCKDENHSCRKLCERTLFCGHVCNRPCHDSDPCEPCKRVCRAKCRHSRCGLRCSEPVRLHFQAHQCMKINPPRTPCLTSTVFGSVCPALRNACGSANTKEGAHLFAVLHVPAFRVTW
jgi:hypothetical protein